MEFWSKGLGKRTLELHLGKSETTKSGAFLYVKGEMEEPVSWDYIMPLEGSDLVDFLALLRERQVAEFLYRSPNRRRLYATLLFGGLRFLGLLLRQVVKGMLSPAPEEPTIQVPPPTERKRRSAGPRRRLKSRRRPGTEHGKSQLAHSGDARRGAQQVG